MNGLLILVLVLAGLTFLALLFVALRAVDWRAFFIRRYGPSYKKGLAHIKIDGVWIYRESRLIYESDIACTYSRITEGGEIHDDIVPNKIGYSYDEYTGRRVYRVIPGGAIAFSDDGEAPAVNFPAGLISTDTLGKVAYDLSTSVKTGGEPFNWKPIIIIGGIIVVIVALLFVFGVLNFPSPGPGQPAVAPATAPPPRIQSDNTTIIFSPGSR